jgi:hypothetical protein
LEPDFMSSWKPFRKSKPQDNMIWFTFLPWLRLMFGK